MKKINTEEFVEWLKEQADYAGGDMKRLAAKEQYEDAICSRAEKDVYDYLISCIERPGYNGIMWMED